MDPITIAVITSLATGYFVNFSTPVVKKFFEKVIALRPSLEQDLKSAKTSQDFDRIFQEAVGVIDATAGSGSIDIDQSFLEAVRGMRFDHQNGIVTIQGSKLKAPILQTGGTGKGETTISGTTMESQGTKIDVGGNAQIKIKGNAQIQQS